MKDQHTKITGYRDLNEQEIALMNEIEAKGAELSDLCERLNGILFWQRKEALDSIEAARIDAAEPIKWLEKGKADLQTGLMALTRAVAQPGSF